MEQLEGLSPSLQRALEAALKTGWGKVHWSGGFTALHLAARDGHEGAVRLLLGLRAECASDHKGFSPVDYAAW